MPAPGDIFSSRHDRATLGDLKSLVYWQVDGVERAAVVPWMKTWSRTQRFTGGIAEASQRSPRAPVALACASDLTQIFYPERDPAAPAGVWKAADVLGSSPQGFRLCAMQKNGVFAEFFPSRSTLVVNRAVSFTLPSVGGFKEVQKICLAQNQSSGVLAGIAKKRPNLFVHWQQGLWHGYH
ncbi:MAG: hypothetical protein M3Q07_03765 [Pseudobdellovibrionaceae bacterium]|nr:hypothetical protein [Pseudobdellovibrionaceae bacterium]